MFVTTCMAGMVTMTTLNNRPEVVKIHTPPVATTPINNTTSMSTNATTIMATTAPTDFAMLFLCSTDPRNWFWLWHKKTDQSINSIKSNTPKLIDSTGELSSKFDLDGQEVFKSCGVTFKNRQYIFGGDGENNKRQILQVKGVGRDRSFACKSEQKYDLCFTRKNPIATDSRNHCGLVKLGSTPFEHRSGSCGSNNDAIVLCFNAYTSGEYNGYDYKHCRQATSPSGPWSDLELSTYEHRLTSIAASPGNLRTHL